jgi:glycerol-3-phosphate dehydrogenase (NAD(P)+)
MRINILGAGAFGTALAVSLAHYSGISTVLWAREEEVARTINRLRFNPGYLPDIPLGKGIQATASLPLIADADVLLLAVPAQYLRGVMEQLKPHLSPGVWLVSCSKGIEAATGMFISEMLAEVCPQNPQAVLSGPAFAAELARGLPTGMVLASNTDCPFRETLAHPTLCLRDSRDVMGCQVAGAVKNIIAIACGLAQGLGYGQNTAAALEVTGLSEIARLNEAKGGKPETILGLAGAGDLALTCGSTQSRNYRLGQALATGKPLATILADQKAVPEGASNAAALHLLCQQLSIQLPLCEAMYQMLYRGLPGNEAIMQSYC